MTDRLYRVQGSLVLQKPMKDIVQHSRIGHWKDEVETTGSLV